MLSRRALNRATLARQLLVKRSRLDCVEAIELLGGLQAQVPRPPFVALWTRLAAFEREQLVRAALEKRVVRGTLMRGTLHLWSAADFVALRSSVQPLLTAMSRGYNAGARHLDVSAIVKDARRRFAKKPFTFKELRAALGADFPESEVGARALMVRTHLPLVMVPVETRWGWPTIARFTMADDWLGEPLEQAHDTAAIVRRYLGAFGPATIADAQKWSGFRTLRDTFEAMRPELVTFRDDDGRELFDLAKGTRPPEDLAVPPRFLGEFDNMLLAYVDRSRVIDPANWRRIYSINGLVSATILVDGIVAGTWRVERVGERAVLEIQAFSALSRPVRAALEEEGEKLAAFLEPETTSISVKIVRD